MHSDWLINLQISFAIYVPMASLFASITREEIIQINFCGIY